MKNAQERVIKGDSSTGHAQFEFSQKYTNRNDRVLNICMSMIRPTPDHFRLCSFTHPTSPVLETCRFILVNK